MAPQKQAASGREGGDIVAEKEGRDELGKFVKGVSGNPAGRPRTSVTALWRRLNAEVDPEDADGRTRAEVLYHRAYSAAVGGDMRAVALIVDRVEGKPKQTVTLTTDTREKLETAVSGLMNDTGCTRDEAIATLSELIPEVSQLNN
jgi:hypothetical protein